MALLSGCSYASVGAGEQAVVVDGYWMIPTDPVVKGCIEPENSQNEITNHVYRYLVGRNGHIVIEVFDADPPFLPGGCIAQAWSVSETLRAWVEIETIR